MELKMAMSPEQMRDSMINNMPKNTGKSLDQWLVICQSSSATKHGELVKWLKAEQGLTHGFANLIAHVKMNGPIVDDNGDDLLAAQYVGAKSELRPVYDALIAAVNGFEGDFEVAPKKAYVSLRRQKQFAIIQPSTKTRLDIGLNLKGEAITNRLEASGSFNSMCSHRVRLVNVEDVDDELLAWIKAAFDKA